MEATEAQALADQLGIRLRKHRKADALFDELEPRGLIIGVDQINGDWVVMKADDPERKVIARVS